MTTRLLAAAAAVALLLTLIINGPFGIDEGTYRKIYSALAPKTAPARDAQQQSENKLPNPEDQVACLIGQAAVSIHGQFGSGHDTEKAAEIAIKQAMRVCPHSLESSDFGFVIAAVEAIAGAIGLEEPADDRDLRFPWFFQGSWCRVEEDERGISLEPARPDHQCSARLTVAATEVGGEIPTVTGEKFLSCSLIEATPNKQGLYFTQLTCADNPWRTGIFLSEGRLLVGKLSASECPRPDPLRILARSGANSSYLDSEQFRIRPRTWLALWSYMAEVAFFVCPKVVWLAESRARVHGRRSNEKTGNVLPTNSWAHPRTIGPPGSVHHDPPHRLAVSRWTGGRGQLAVF